MMLAQTEPSINRASLSGRLGAALDRNLNGRLKAFIESPESAPIALFGTELKGVQTTGDWYGEHAGKWLVAASRAALRTNDVALVNAIREVVAFLIGQQEGDGYLGTYAPEASSRFTNRAAAQGRTWDVWNHAYLILGFLEADRLLPESGCIEAAKRIASLLDRTFSHENSITMYGNHSGLSAVVALDAVVSLATRTGNPEHLGLASRILEMEESAPALGVVAKAHAGMDASELATGKAYQLIWFFTGVAKLAHKTQESFLLEACVRFWENVSQYHLTLGGGPWGGIGRHSELFHPKGFFTPYGFVETCSAMAWMDFNAELLDITGEGRFADATESTLWNTILGAADINGLDWSYFTFPNGRRNSTYDWACCKSSGALALETFAHRLGRVQSDAITIDFYTPARIQIGEAVLRVETGYPSEENVRVIFEKAVETTLRLRIPSWAKSFQVRVNGAKQDVQSISGYVALNRMWAAGDGVELVLSLAVIAHPAATIIDHHGQEVMRLDYVAATYGPLVLATGLLDGFRREETLHVPQLSPERCYAKVAVPEGFDGPAFELRTPGRKPILFVPYYEAGGRTDGKWRLTWMQAAWQ